MSRATLTFELYYTDASKYEQVFSDMYQLIMDAEEDKMVKLVRVKEE